MKSPKFTLIFLVVLTVISAIVSETGINASIAIIIILMFFKFLAVAFHFMELKLANPFWKTVVILFLSVFSLTTLLILQ